MITAFDLAYMAVAPVAVPLYLSKLWRARRPLSPLWDRLRGPFLEPAAAARIWVHAVSVGEVLATRTLVEALGAAMPGHEVVVSSSTETGREVAAKTYGPGRIFPCPLDLSPAVRRAFDGVKPALLVLMELEVWPNMVAEAARRGVPVAVVNGRITDRSARGYARLGPLIRGTMGRLSLCAVQTAAYAERFKAIGVPAARIRITGSMKYDAVPVEEVSAEDRRRLRAGLGLAPDALVLVGGSTHPGEEAALLSAAAGLREAHPALRVVIVPRHVNRAAAAERDIRAAGWKVRRRSQLTPAKALLGDAQVADEVLLVDTMGELGDVYRAGDLAFVGGSLIPHGGQNMMEPAGLGLPVLYGPHTGNFSETVAMLDAGGGGMTVTGIPELKDALRLLLGDAGRRAEMGRAGRVAIGGARGATARNVALLTGLLSGSGTDGAGGRS